MLGFTSRFIRPGAIIWGADRTVVGRITEGLKVFDNYSNYLGEFRGNVFYDRDFWPRYEVREDGSIFEFQTFRYLGKIDEQGTLQDEHFNRIASLTDWT